MAFLHIIVVAITIVNKITRHLGKDMKKSHFPTSSYNFVELNQSSKLTAIRKELFEFSS